MTDKTSHTVSVGVILALFLTVLVMRGPITGIGAVADELMAVLEIRYASYGFLSALPIVCFGLFCAAAPLLTARFGVNGVVIGSLGMILIGAAARLYLYYPTMLVATAFIGIGIALLNVVMPVVLRKYFPNNIALTMGVFTGLIGFSGSIGAYFSVPLLEKFETLLAPLGLWVILAALPLLLWLFEKRSSDRMVTVGKINASVLKKPLTWAVIFVMGMQSLTIYTTVAWLPSILATLDFDASTAGLGSAIFLLVSAPASILTSRFISLVGGERNASIWMTVSFLVGIVLWLQGGAFSYLGCVLAGIPQGITFSLAMILMAQKTNDLSELLIISTLAQGIGYVLAAVGPFVCGLLYHGDGNWIGVAGFMMSAVLLWGVSAFYAFGTTKKLFTTGIK